MPLLRYATLIVLMSCGSAYAVVNQGTNIIFRPRVPDVLGNYEGVVFPDAGPIISQGFSKFYFYFDPSLGNLQSGSGTLGGTQAKWFLVGEGDTFDADTIAAGFF